MSQKKPPLDNDYIKPIIKDYTNDDGVVDYAALNRVFGFYKNPKEFRLPPPDCGANFHYTDFF